LSRCSRLRKQVIPGKVLFVQLHRPRTRFKVEERPAEKPEIAARLSSPVRTMRGAFFRVHQAHRFGKEANSYGLENGDSPHEPCTSPTSKLLCRPDSKPEISFFGLPVIPSARDHKMTGALERLRPVFFLVD
jgi:hypothetical protein